MTLVDLSWPIYPGISKIPPMRAGPSLRDRRSRSI
jgi:hypothetical protein